ncbi:nucleotide kinase domain-containing protein [Sphingobium boeckii]|uniref:5-hmdU DNA kinase helical domain-containing protein n=1 Tax=Sphingobium boeckii TaxID=1082345 RepID=A0A7W9ALF2_9SPHN|nr:hypothetical protein [Sphingobium boeckii]
MIQPARRIADVPTTPVYDLYWRFATERQAIFMRRLRGEAAPWTYDPIFQRHRFTNAYRASDRVSQYLIREVIYNPAHPDIAIETVFRILLFKLFNKVETWNMLERELGPPSWQSFDIERYAKVLGDAIDAGRRIYSPAYIMPPVSLGRGGPKHVGHLKLIDLILRSDFVARLQQSRSLDEVFGLLKAFPSLGDFLAFQLAIDLNYSMVINHDEADFVVAGPGARDGLAKTFVDAAGVDPVDLIRLMRDRQQAEFDRLDLAFEDLWGRPLQLIDCQNLFCEISKYTRVSHPDIMGLSGRSRIKQIYRGEERPVQPWYPPKWGLNKRIPIFPTTVLSRDLFEVHHEAV